MSELRVYTSIETTEILGGYPVFYSRCEGGPYYRWSYNDNARKWQAGRILPSVISPKTLAAAPWKTIPAQLKRSISDHYQE